MKKEELLRNEITAIEIGIDTIKQNLTIARYLTDSVEGMIMSISYSIEQIENDLKNIKALYKVDGEKNG
jgi:ACT domain-containing protein